MGSAGLNRTQPNLAETVLAGLDPAEQSSELGWARLGRTQLGWAGLGSSAPGFAGLGTAGIVSICNWTRWTTLGWDRLC